MNPRNIFTELLFPLGGGMLLSLSLSCSAPKNQAPPSQNSATVVASPSPTPEVFKTREHDNFTIQYVSNEPVALLDVKLTKPEKTARSGLVLELQNVSGKSVKLVQYGIEAYPLCGDFMYSVIPSPRLAYESENGQPPLKPNDKASIRVSNVRELRLILNPATYQSCPAGHQKPILSLWRVQFADGEVWEPDAMPADL